MSKKTKRQKIAAEGRRRFLQGNQTSESASLQTLQSANSGGRHLTVGSSTIKLNMGMVGVSGQSKAVSYEDYSHVKKDLVKILVLTLIAICAQVVLWYFLGNRI